MDSGCKAKSKKKPCWLTSDAPLPHLHAPRKVLVEGIWKSQVRKTRECVPCQVNCVELNVRQGSQAGVCGKLRVEAATVQLGTCKVGNSPRGAAGVRRAELQLGTGWGSKGCGGTEGGLQLKGGWHCSQAPDGDEQPIECVDRHLQRTSRRRQGQELTCCWCAVEMHLDLQSIRKRAASKSGFEASRLRPSSPSPIQIILKPSCTGPLCRSKA
eukprot:361885-Chlamydomonas_euryale.AAC.15